MTINLPFPPSVNMIWRTMVRGKRAITYMSADGKEYRNDVRVRVLESGIRSTLTGRLTVEILIHPPDRRKRDIDNSLKALLDSMQHAGVYKDDSQIDWLLVRRGDLRSNGCVEVTIKEYPADGDLPL